MLGPTISVIRSPMGVGNFERLSGDDPYLGSRIGPAYIRGVQEQGVLAVARGFAFQVQEMIKRHYNTEVDERTAWELYYPPFMAAVEAGVGGIMCAHNKVNGTK